MLLGSAAPTSTTGTPNFLVPNGTFIYELVIFVIVLGIVARVILPPLNAALREREERIRSGIEAGEEGRAEADRLEGARRAALDDARLEARGILEAAQRDAEAKREAARARGQAEYDRLLAAATGTIDEERQRTIDEVSSALESLVVEAAERIIGSPVDPARHHEAIERARTELGATDEV
jgi:F-type H+-transporting ATPase subunit b